MIDCPLHDGRADLVFTVAAAQRLFRKKPILPFLETPPLARLFHQRGLCRLKLCQLFEAMLSVTARLAARHDHGFLSIRHGRGMNFTQIKGGDPLCRRRCNRPSSIARCHA